MKIFAFALLLLGSEAWAGWSATSYNIRNFDRDHEAGHTNIAELSKTIKTYQSDVMTFIEVVNQLAFEKVIKATLPGYDIAISSCGGFGKQKLAIVYNTKVFSFVSQAEETSFSGSQTGCGSLRPVLLVTLNNKSQNKNYTFAAVHLKAGGAEQAMQQRWLQYDLLSKLVTKYKSKQLVLMGDFNTTGYNIRNEDFTRFDKTLAQSSLYTVSERLDCTSYWSGTSGNGRHQASTLDHIVMKEDLAQEISQVTLGSHCAKMACKDATPEELGVSYQTVSDHCPIQVNFK